MAFDNIFRDIQPQPRPARQSRSFLRPVEPLEQVRQAFRGDSPAGIRYLDANGFQRLPGRNRAVIGAQNNLAVGDVVFHGIVQQIKNDLFYLRPIGIDIQGIPDDFLAEAQPLGVYERGDDFGAFRNEHGGGEAFGLQPGTAGFQPCQIQVIIRQFIETLDLLPEGREHRMALGFA